MKTKRNLTPKNGAHPVSRPVIASVSGSNLIGVKCKEEAPKELEAIWDDEVNELWLKLRPQQRDFVIQYLITGNAAESYRRVYNPMASNHLAQVAGSRMLSGDIIGQIMIKFAQQKTAALLKVVTGYHDMADATKPQWQQDKDGQWENAGDSPDWVARDKALIGLTRIHALNAPVTKEIKDSQGNLIQTETTYNTDSLKEILNGSPE